jgi:hypothetical protein
MRRATLALLALLLWVAPAAQAADGSLTLSLSRASASYGSTVVASGLAQPAAAGEEVVIEIVTGDASTQVARTTTDAGGVFTVAFEATRGGLAYARSLGSGAVSGPAPLEVIPDVRLRAGPGRALLGARLRVRVVPATYSARVSIVVRSGVHVVGTLTGRVSSGRLHARVPLPGVGRFAVVLTFPAAGGLSSRIASVRLRATARTLSVGSSGADVRALSRRLAALRIRVPGVSSSFGYSLSDSVIAFQKAYRLPRTGVVGLETWRALTRVEPLRPRYRGPAAHIEIDKTRQILLDVRNGNVVAILPVSSGATGNTPEGKHHIRWKALATTTWLGPAILYRTMTFYGNSFAIHGFPSVPAYPASHGCVRIPIWAADWLYDRSPVGETVYVYT